VSPKSIPVIALAVLIGCDAADPSAPAPAASAPVPAATATPAATAPVAAPTSTGTAPAAPDTTTRDVADAAFNRAMTAYEGGDQAAAAQLIPLALTAYGAAGPLDSDGQFHVALLQLASGDTAATLETTTAMLDQHPGHLLALGVAVQAAQAQGDATAAATYASQLVQAYEGEQGKLPEYADHAVLLPIYRDAALPLLDNRDKR